MSLINIDSDCFPALNSKFEFIAMESPELIKARQWWYRNGEYTSQLGLLRVSDVDIDVLKKFGIWDKLTPEVQKVVEGRTAEEKNAVNSLMEKARASRRERYPNVPRELLCSCGAREKISPGILVKKIENIMAKKGILYTLEDYLKTYQCSKCCPRKRGRQSTGNTDPIKLSCKCGKTTTYPTAMVQQRAVKAGKEFKEFVETWQCRKCRPKAERNMFGGKRGRQPNPEFINLPKEMACNKCGGKVKTNPSYLKLKAKKLNTTIEKLIEKFVCQSCSPSRGRPKKLKK